MITRCEFNRFRGLILRGAVVVFLCAAVAAVRAETPKAPAAASDARIAELLAKMTLEEKLGQLTQQWGGESKDVNPGIKDTKAEELYGMVRAGQVGSFLGSYGAEFSNRVQHVAMDESRLKIPMIIGNDVIHGYRTIFPIPLAEASSFDPAVAERAARVAAIEAAAGGTHWTFAPMVDICRDPRWGRVVEGAGEDPYLGAAIAAARVRGFQGANLAAPDAIMACVKHFAAYGGPEGGRDYNTVDISPQTLREVYLPPFAAAVKAGAGSLMCSFNEINGVPSSGNSELLTDILRKEWGFKGFVVSDWSSVTEMIAHGFALDPQDAAAKAIAAGVDMDMSSFSYRTFLGKALEKDKVTQDVIDRAVRRVLEAKAVLGLFDDPYVDPAVEKKVILCAEHRATARDVARHSIVLLRNEGNVLPISEKVKSIAVVGPLADNAHDMLGTWAAFGRDEDVVSILAGLKQRAGAIKIEHAKGCGITDADTSGIAAAATVAKGCDLALVVVGESEALSGEGHSRSSLDLPGVQDKLVRAIQGTGVPTVLVLVNGRPLSTPWASEHVPAIVEAWQLGVESGNAVADVLFGDFNPSGRMPVTVPRTVGQVPIYYAHKNTGRPPTDDRFTSKYIDLPPTPLYPFGYGMSYTTFKYGNIKLNATKIAADGTLTVEADVTNTGTRVGDEIVQLYVRDLVGSLTRPVKQLRGFERVNLKPGESKTVKFTLGSEHLGFYNRELKYVVEPGAFKVWVGPNSAEGVEAEFEVAGK
jgi:beta-glucosidase